MRRILFPLIIVLAQTAISVESCAQTQESSCPSITIESKVNNPPWGVISGGPCPGTPVTFTAAVAGINPKQKYTFYWTVSAGEIVEGQGTSSIKVSTDEDSPNSVTATVELVGLSGHKSECNKTAQATVYFAGCCLPPCPALSIQCPEDPPQPGQPVTVSVNVSGGYPYKEVGYKWKVSAGEIVSGQGTPAITVSTANSAGQSITATVELEGFGPECDRTEACTLPVVEYSPPSRLFARYDDINEGDEKTRLDGLVFQLGREPGARAYVIVYGGRNSTDSVPRLERIRKYLVGAGHISPDRVVTMDGGRREVPAIELYIRPVGAAPPKSNPDF